MRVSFDRKQGQLPNGAIKIGAVARHFGVSVDLLRLYEREGLLIPLKSAGGTRYFTEHDYLWIGTIVKLVRQARLNFAGIRHLLALLPCWEIRNCGFADKSGCTLIDDSTQPCWVNSICCAKKNSQDCYFCPVYRASSSCENLKALLAKPQHSSASAAAAAN